MWMYNRGLRFGYPTCCIEAFASRLSGVPFTEQQLAVAKHNFIPCRMHAIMIAEHGVAIETLITNRQEVLPFGTEVW